MTIAAISIVIWSLIILVVVTLCGLALVVLSVSGQIATGQLDKALNKIAPTIIQIIRATQIREK